MAFEPETKSKIYTLQLRGVLSDIPPPNVPLSTAAEESYVLSTCSTP